MKIELEEKELKTLKLMETGELDIVLQDAIQHFVDESMAGKHLTLTFKINDWKKAAIFVMTLFSLKRDGSQNDTGMSLEKIDYDQKLYDKLKFSQGLIDYLKSMGLKITIN